MRALLISDPEIGRSNGGGAADEGDRRDMEDEEDEEDSEDEEDGEEGEEEEGEEEEEEEEEDEDGGDGRASRARGKAGSAHGEEDEGGKKAACALCLGVGYLSDPSPRVDGLAHFTEHMLFMGTEEYPGENEWSQLLSAHGGALLLRAPRAARRALSLSELVVLWAFGNCRCCSLCPFRLECGAAGQLRAAAARGLTQRV